MPARVLALATYPEEAAASRFRVIGVAPYLRDAGIEVDFRPFLSSALFREFYAKGHRVVNAARMAAAVSRRLRLLLRGGRYDAVFVQREAALVGPAVIESVLTDWFDLPMVFDFDDAIWLDAVEGSTHPRLARWVKAPGKTFGLLRRAAHVLAGSASLAQFARQHNPVVSVTPTVVSRDAWTPLPGRLDGRFPHDGPPRIGWVGTATTTVHLDLVMPALRRLRSDGFSFRLSVVGGSRRASFEGLDVDVRPWQSARDILDFQELDIGLAPTSSTAWTEGKCGFKQVQYMAVGVPCVSSLVGGARDFVRDRDNALVASTEDDWYHSLRALLEDPSLRSRLARAGRQLVEDDYCLEVQGPRVAAVVAGLV
jgi:glycosyltransferase involved in cell wall biosynthesis